MMAVKWEFEGDALELAAAQTVVQRLLTRHGRALERIRCAVHGSASLLIVRGRTLEDLSLSLVPCCQVLIAEANARILRGRGRRALGSAVHGSLPRGPGSDRRLAIRRAEPDFKGLFLNCGLPDQHGDWEGT
jgi:hypothetical protein